MYANESPRCIHQWKPHEENPVTSLFFLDNHKDHNPEDQFWKFALTGSSNNTEIKLWSCEHWTCLQTVQIKPTDGKRTELKAELDLTAQYLLLSDIHRKNVYVLQLEISNDKVLNEFYLIKNHILFLLDFTLKRVSFRLGLFPSLSLQRHRHFCQWQ